MAGLFCGSWGSANPGQESPGFFRASSQIVHAGCRTLYRRCTCAPYPRFRGLRRRMVAEEHLRPGRATDRRRNVMFESILVPLDGSPYAESVLSYVVLFARTFNAPVTLLHIIDLERYIPSKSMICKSVTGALNVLANR